MDKEWMKLPRPTKEYCEGVDFFIDFAFKNVSKMEKILCPCKKCINNLWWIRGDVRKHLIINGFVNNYTAWIYHGEASPFRTSRNENDKHNDEGDKIRDNPCDQVANLKRGMTEYMVAADKELYPGCKKVTDLSFIVQLYNLKCISKWSDKLFDLLINLLKVVLPEGETLPNNFYETKKLCVTNKAKRLKQTLGDTGDTKSFPKMHEMTLQNGGVQPDRAEMGCVTHTHKNSKAMDGAADTIDKIKQFQAEASSSGGSSQSTGRNYTLSKILPVRHGRLRAMGFGATATNTWGPLESDERLKALEAELASWREEIRAKTEEIRAEREETRTVIEQLKADNQFFKEFFMRTQGVNFEDWPNSSSHDPRP